MSIVRKMVGCAAPFSSSAKELTGIEIFCGRSLSRVPAGALVCFPVHSSRLACGLAGLVARPPELPDAGDTFTIEDMEAGITRLAARTLEKCSADQGLTGA